MLFEKHYYYYQVKFDDERSYWYRALSHEYRPGTKVIVPVSKNGIWKTGTVTEKRKCKADEVPYPVERTKGIVSKAGWLGEEKVKRHNTAIETSKYPPCDISVARIRTERGIVSYITCQAERNFARKSLLNRNKELIIIENYPPAKLSEIPPEAQKIVLKKRQEIIEGQRRINEQKKRREEEELLRSIEFQEEMEDLDQYN